MPLQISTLRSTICLACMLAILQASAQAQPSTCSASSNSPANSSSTSSTLTRHDIEKLIEKYPQDGSLWYLLGQTYERQSANPGDIIPIPLLILPYVSTSTTSTTSTMDARIAPMLSEAEQSLQSGNLVRACASFREAITIYPTKPDLYRKLADTLRKMGEADEARKMEDRASKLEKLASPH